MSRSFIGLVGFKKNSTPTDFPLTAFICGEKTTRKQLKEFLLDKDEEHDLRTIKFVEEINVICERPQLIYHLIEDHTKYAG